MLLAGVVLLLPLLSRNVLGGSVALLPGLAMSMAAALSVYGATKIGPSISKRSRDPAMWLALAVPLFMTISAVAHQLAGAWFTVSFALGAAMLTLVVRDMTRTQLRLYVAYPLLATASIQALLAITQLATGRAIVPEWIAADIKVLVIDGVARPQGTMYHVYHLAALGLMAIGVWIAVRMPRARIPLPVMLALGLSTAMVTITFSRSALLALMAIIAAMVVGGFRGNRSAYTIAAILASVGLVTMLFTTSGWSTRADQSAAPNLDDASLGRLTLTRQAFALIEAEPLFGVGPGQFVEAVRERGLINDEHPYIVHDYPLAVAAENGLLGGVIVAVLLIWLGIAAMRAGPDTSATYLALVPLLVLDVLHYVYPSPQLMFGIWLGVLSAAIRWQTADRAHTSRRTRSP